MYSFLTTLTPGSRISIAQLPTPQSWEAQEDFRKINLKVKIFSGEHQSYWRPDEKGYTADLNAAGIYNFQAAHEILRMVGPEKMLTIEIIHTEYGR